MTDPRIEAAARALCADRGIAPDDNEEFGRHFGKDHNWQAYVYMVSIVLAAADAEAWRPIETAPEGKAVLVLADDGFCAEGKKHTRGYYKGWWVCSSACDPKESLQPTHWQPLPAPPVNNDALGGRDG